MNLRLIREPSIGGTTLGVLFAGGHYECFILEDEIRECPDVPVEQWKVPGQTAIPAGRYRVVVTDSPKFGRRLPELLNVPGFTGIRIHAGNRKEDTEGCLITGRWRAAQAVGESRVALERLISRIERALTAGEQVWVDIENPPPAAVAAA